MKKCFQCGAAISEKHETGNAVCGLILCALFLAWFISMIAMPLDLIARDHWQVYQHDKWSMAHGRGYWATQTALQNAQIENQISGTPGGSR